MTIAIAVVLGLLAVNFVLLYRKALREILGLSAYAQFLLMNPDVYKDQREKFVAYLAGTEARTSTQRAIDAHRSIARIADNMRPQLVLANVAARNALAR